MAFALALLLGGVIALLAVDVAGADAAGVAGPRPPTVWQGTIAVWDGERASAFGGAVTRDLPPVGADNTVALPPVWGAQDDAGSGGDAPNTPDAPHLRVEPGVTYEALLDATPRGAHADAGLVWDTNDVYALNLTHEVHGFDQRIELRVEATTSVCVTLTDERGDIVEAEGGWFAPCLGDLGTEGKEAAFEVFVYPHKQYFLTFSTMLPGPVEYSFTFEAGRA